MARTIMPEGSPNAKIALIGEAPGSQEERMGRPFVGPSGQLLDEMLRNAGIFRQHCYITNVVKERPPNNDITTFIDLRKKTPKLTPVGARYLEEFKAEVQNLGANVLVPMGNVALWALTGLTLVSKRHGSILRTPEGRKVIPTIHPAAIVREYMFKYPAMNDLRRIKAQAEFPDIRLPEYDLRIAPTYLAVELFLEQLQEAPRVYLDIEVLSMEVACIAIGDDHTSMSIPFLADTGHYFTEQEEVHIWENLAKIIENPDIVKVGQNLTFDASFIFMKYGIVFRNMEDTMIAQGITYPDLPKGLDFLTATYTEQPYYKDEGKIWFKLGGSFEDLWRYNDLDIAVLPEIWEKQQGVITKQKNKEAYQRQRDLIEPLVYMSTHGIRADVSGIKEASAKSGIELHELIREFHDVCGYDCNPSSPAQLKELFYVRRNHKPYVSRTTGAATTDRDALKRLARKGDKAAEVLLKIRKLGKLRSTYYEAKIDPDGRLRCSFNPVGTSSGRLSSGKTIAGTGLNFQNMPDLFRRYLLTDSGYLGYQLDLSQAENRTVAYVAPDPLMIDAFEGGIDVHRLTAALIFNKKLEEVSDEPGSSTIGGGVYSERFWGKKANHGLNYDLGYKTFAFYYEIPESDAKYIVERYHQAYPGVRRYHEWVKQELRTKKALTDCLGKTRLFLDRWGDQLWKEAYSYIPQSTVGGKCNRDGVLELWYNRDTTYRHVELLNQVHDSVWIQIPLTLPLSEHARILSNLKESMERPLTWQGRTFKIPVDVECCVCNFGKVVVHQDGTVENPHGLKKLKFTTLEEVTKQLEERYLEYKEKS